MPDEKKEEKELEWMPMYWDKFLSATTHFSAAEIGGYCLLIAHQWKHGWIPEDIKIQKKIARVSSTSVMNHIRTKFLKINDKMINVVCQNIRDEQLQKFWKASKRNSENAKKRYQSPASGITIGTTTGIQNNRIIDNKIISKEIIKKIIIGTKEFLQCPSEFFLEHDQIYFESLMQTLFTGIDQKIILQQFDDEYTYYDFKDLNHLRNSFKLIGKKIKEKSEKNSKSDFKNGKQNPATRPEFSPDETDL
jgi:uncharacterized protein YdaU (DUF1376 family)